MQQDLLWFAKLIDERDENRCPNVYPRELIISVLGNVPSADGHMLTLDVRKEMDAMLALVIMNEFPKYVYAGFERYGKGNAVEH